MGVGDEGRLAGDSEESAGENGEEKEWLRKLEIQG